MKLARLCVPLAACLLFLAGSTTTLRAQNYGASFVLTILDSQGNFASRGVLTLHGDHTLSVTDSGQGGPFFFTSQLGAWKFNKVGIVARTVDFDYPPNADSGRLDYTITAGSSPGRISGTITLTIFPLTGNPLGSGGTVVGSFTFTGQLINP